LNNLTRYIEQSFQNYFYENVEVPKSFEKLEISHKKLKTYSGAANIIGVNGILQKVEKWNNSKKAVLVIDEYIGIRNHLFCPKNSILFTSNEASDKIIDNIIHIPLLNQTEKSIYAGKNIKERDYLYSFVGNQTHKIRKELLRFSKEKNVLIDCSNNLDNIDFNNIIANSVFTLAPRGVNISSYRICEALRNESIPVYISDDFRFPENFTDYGIVINSYEIEYLDNILRSISTSKRLEMIEQGKIAYKKLFTYEGLSEWIYNKLLNII